MHVPFVSLKSSYDQIRDEVRVRLDIVLEKGDFILGEEVGEFEKGYAQFSQARHAIGVSNGLDALKISLRALGIGAGDEVIVPAHTYIATVFAVMEVGATPVLIEPDIITYNITAATIAPAITAKTKAIIPVHLYGQPCDMDGIMRLAKRHSLYVIEDNAQAQGATYKGKRTGSFGHINATSFYPSKNLGAMGDAGAITTDDESLSDKAKLLRNMGSPTKYHHNQIGYNARLDTLQAAVLNCKLPHLSIWNNERRIIADRYISNLENCKSIIQPQTIDSAEHMYHLFVIRHHQRDDLQSYLNSNEIQTLIHYPVPLHLQPALAPLGYVRGDFPITEAVSCTCLSLPIYSGITMEQVDFVSDKIIAFDKQFS